MNIRLFEQILFEASKDRFLRPLFDKYANKNYGENDYDSILKWIDSGAADKHKFDWQSKDKEKLFNNIYNSYSDYMKSGGSRKNQKKDPINIFKNSGLKFDTIETADEDTELLFQGETDKWLYISPLSWEAAKWMDSLNCGGQGAQWCIGYEKTDDYWKKYTDNESKFVLAFDKENYAEQVKDEIKYMLEIISSDYVKVWNQLDDNIRYYGAYKDLNIEEVINNFEKALSQKPIIFNGFKIINGHCDIPDGTTEIEDKAFYGCESLESITIPNSVTEIGYDVFAYCASLKSIYIPNSVTKIGYYAFAHCKSLKSITIPNSVTKIRSRAFSDCESLESINIPDSVTEIGTNAFCNCESLQSINIPDSVTKIGDFAFYNCKSLKHVLVSRNTKIDETTFKECPNIEIEYQG